MARHTRALFNEAAYAVAARRKRADKLQKERIRLERERVRVSGRTDELGQVATSNLSQAESARIGRIRAARATGVIQQPGLARGKAALAKAQLASETKLGGRRLSNERFALQIKRDVMLGVPSDVNQQDAAAQLPPRTPSTGGTQPDTAKIPPIPQRRSLGEKIGGAVKRLTTPKPLGFDANTSQKELASKFVSQSGLLNFASQIRTGATEQARINKARRKKKVQGMTR